MGDVYHWCHWYVLGEIDGEALVAGVVDGWNERVAADPGGPLDRAQLWLDKPTVRVDRVLDQLGGQPDALMWFHNDSPRDEEARAVWGPACGQVVDALLELVGVDRWVLSCDEHHVIGVWGPGGAVINTLVGMEGWSMREPLALMLIDRFEAHGVPYELVDLGGDDIPN